jgi:hypothetical protein
MEGRGDDTLPLDAMITSWLRREKRPFACRDIHAMKEAKDSKAEY